MILLFYCEILVFFQVHWDSEAGFYLVILEVVGPSEVTL